MPKSLLWFPQIITQCYWLSFSNSYYLHSGLKARYASSVFGSIDYQVFTFPLHCFLPSFSNYCKSPSINMPLFRMKFLKSTTSQAYSVALDAGPIIVSSLHPFMQPTADENTPQKQNTASVLNMYYVSLLPSFSKWYNVTAIHTANDIDLGRSPDTSSLYANWLPLYIRDSCICGLWFSWGVVLEPTWIATVNCTAFSVYTQACLSSLLSPLSPLSSHRDTRSSWHTKHYVTMQTCPQGPRPKSLCLNLREFLAYTDCRMVCRNLLHICCIIPVYSLPKLESSRKETHPWFFFTLQGSRMM